MFCFFRVEREGLCRGIYAEKVFFLIFPELLPRMGSDNGT